MPNARSRPVPAIDSMDSEAISQDLPPSYALPIWSPRFSSAAACAYVPQSLLDLVSMKKN